MWGIERNNEKRECVRVKTGRYWDIISEGKENLEAAMFKKGKKTAREKLCITEMEEEKPNMYKTR